MTLRTKVNPRVPELETMSNSFHEENTLDLDDLEAEKLDALCQQAQDMPQVNNVNGSSDDMELLNLEPSQNEDVIVLEPVPESTHALRTSRRRLTRENWGIPPEPTDPAHRPGRRPAIMDDELTQADLLKKNRRRAQNKKAAARQRQKRGDTVKNLQDENDRLLERNQKQQQKIAELLERDLARDKEIKQVRGQLAAALRATTLVYVANDMNTNKPTEQEHCQTQSYPDGHTPGQPMNCYFSNSL